MHGVVQTREPHMVGVGRAVDEHRAAGLRCFGDVGQLLGVQGQPAAKNHHEVKVVRPFKIIEANALEPELRQVHDGLDGAAWP